MRVACNCGCVFSAPEHLACCPYCGKPAALPQVSAREAAEMECDLALILAEHEPCVQEPKLP